jgi:cellulose synthase/poly-beta-1,6-N-acetylglucosamine synthase-like glycosyltransferase
MFDLVDEGISYLSSQSLAGVVYLFWFVILFEVPRYTLSFLSVIATGAAWKQMSHRRLHIGRVSVVVAGHNEEDSIERCVQSLRNQSQPPDEIIAVSDGSTDRMAQKLYELQERGLIQEAHVLEMRGGKSAGVNLCAGRASGDIVVNVDCDCTYDRHALREICRPFVDPHVGGVAGNILVRNESKSLIATFQAIEYMISISQGKQAANLTDQMTCVSGAFGAFRRKALMQVGGLDSGGGEDLDVTLKLRTRHWRTVFAEEAICYTDVPETLSALTRQRFRWERDAVRLRYRKHRAFLNPFSTRFSFIELLHELDFLIFNIAAAAAFPLYLVWLFVVFGDLAPVILLGAQAGMLVLDTFTFLLAASVAPKAHAARLAPFLVGYSLLYGFYMRFVRLAAYMQEWVFRASYEDSYVPRKVHLVRK